MGALAPLIARVEEACSREGKPSGQHMIDSQRMIARHFGASGDRKARDIADVADCMAHCIENEALLFECLRTEAFALLAAIKADTTASPGAGAQPANPDPGAGVENGL